MAQELSKGQVIGQRYRVRERLGKGGMGSVYEAEEMATGDVVALKVLSSELVEDPRFVERFRREAEATARLAHPNIVRVLAFEHRPSEPALIAMERLRGEPLIAPLRRGPMSVKRALSVALQLTDALAAAHRAGVVHRDLKPANVFLTPLAYGGVLVKLLDFGIAKLKESDGYNRLTQTGVLIGTPRYASPEQVRGERSVDARSDIFSLGVLLYGMLAGRPPFTSKGAALLMAIQSEEPPPLADSIPADLRQVVRTAMAKRREDRFPDMDAFASALQSVSVSRVSSAAPEPEVPGDEARRATVRDPSPLGAAGHAALPAALPPAAVPPAAVPPAALPPAARSAAGPAVVSPAAMAAAPATRELALVPKTPARGTPRHALPSVAPRPTRVSGPPASGPSRPSPARSSAPHARVSHPGSPDETAHGLRGSRPALLPRGLLVLGVLLVALAVVGISFVGGALWLRGGSGAAPQSTSSASAPARVDGVEVWSTIGWTPAVDYLPSRAARELGPACVEWEYQACACMSLTPNTSGPCRAALASIRSASANDVRFDCEAQIRPRTHCAETAASPDSLAPGSPPWVAWAELRASQYGPSCTALWERRCSCDPTSSACLELEYDLQIAPSNDSARRRVLEACRGVPDDEAPPCP